MSAEKNNTSKKVAPKERISYAKKSAAWVTKKSIDTATEIKECAEFVAKKSIDTASDITEGAVYTARKGAEATIYVANLPVRALRATYSAILKKARDANEHIRESRRIANEQYKARQDAAEEIVQIRKGMHGWTKIKKLGKIDPNQPGVLFGEIIDRLSPENKAFYPLFLAIFTIYQQSDGDIVKIEQVITKIIESDGSKVKHSANHIAECIISCIKTSLPRKRGTIKPGFNINDSNKEIRQKIRHHMENERGKISKPDFFRKLIIRQYDKNGDINPIQIINETLTSVKAVADTMPGFVDDIRTLRQGRIAKKEAMHDDIEKKEGLIGDIDEIKADFLAYCAENCPILPKELKVLIGLSHTKSEAILSVIPDDNADLGSVRRADIGDLMKRVVEWMFGGTGIKAEEIRNFDDIFIQIHASETHTQFEIKKVWQMLEKRMSSQIADRNGLFLLVKHVANQLPAGSLSLSIKSDNLRDIDKEKVENNVQAVIQAILNESPEYGSTIKRINVLYAIFHGHISLPKGHRTSNTLDRPDKIIEREIFKDLLISDTAADVPTNFQEAVEYLITSAPFGLIKQLQKTVKQILENASTYFNENTDIEDALSNMIKYIKT